MNKMQDSLDLYTQRTQAVKDEISNLLDDSSESEY